MRWWLALLALAAAPRIAGLSTEFWLDEIWSLNLASSLRSPWGVFTALHHDNNHYLNTLFMCLLGDRADWRLHRLLSLAAGVATVPVAVLIGRLRSGREGWIAGILVACSFPLIVYSSEARGYAPMILCAFLSFYFLQKGRHAAFSAAASLGLLSQLTFLHFYLPAAALSWARLRKRPSELIRCHLLPGGLLIFLYFVDLRRLTIGGGLRDSPWTAAMMAASWALGLPEAAGLLAAALAAGALLLQWREGSDRGYFYLGAIVLGPALVLMLGPSPLAYARYFLAPIAFFLLLFSGFLARMGRGALSAILVVYLLGNGWRTVRFLQEGRGRYAEAVDYMVSHGAPGQATVSSDHDFRNRTVLLYYLQRAGLESAVTYVKKDEKTQARWRLLHTLESDAAVPPAEPGYVFEKAFRHWGPSGWTWFLYRKEGA